MKTIGRLFYFSLFATGLVGCAADASIGASGKESVGVTSAADTAAYLQTFDQDFQAIIFQPSSTIDWVILHVTIDGTRTTNVPMPEIGTSAAAGPAYEIESLPVVAGDTVVGQVVDCGVCTAAHLDRYYSYRAEKGKTGRMWAVFMIE